MATLISASGGGNWSALATWRSLVAGTGTIQTQTGFGGGVSSTTYIGVGWSVAMTITSGEVIEGVGLYLLSNGTTGTVTVALSDDGGTTATREVTVNSSDLPRFTSWVFFKFGTTLTADGGSDYKVSVKNSSGGSTVSLSRSSTAYNFARFVRSSSAPGSLAAGDVFYIVDDLTGAGAKTANTVTMDCLASAITDFGEINVGFGTLNCGVAAATNYYLKASGNCNVWGGGYFNVGSVGTPLPQDSTAIFELDPTSDGEFGFIFKDGSVVTVQGYPMTKVWTLLNANASANDTSLTTLDSTDWKDNDQIVIASTSRTATETEAGTLNGNASGTTLTVDGFAGTGGGVAYAHDGSATGGPGGADIRAEIINLTRNVKFRSATSTIMTYIYASASATTDFDYVEMYYLGENVTTKRGLEIATTSVGSCSIQNCSFHDCEDFGVYVSTTSGSVTFVFNVCHRLNTAQAASQFGAYFTGTSGAHTITDNVFLALQSSNQRAVEMLDTGSTFSRNRIAGSQGTATIALGLVAGAGELGGGACDDNVLHSNIGAGISFTYASLNPTVYSNWMLWRNGSYGATISPQSVGYISFANFRIFGNTTANLLVNGSSIVVLDTCDLQSDTAYTTTQGIYNTNTSLRLTCKNCTIGTAVPHTSYGINVTGLQIYLHNTTIGDSVEVNTSSLSPLGFVRSYKHDASGTTHRSWYRYGTVASDQSVRHTASGYAWKMNPIYYIYGAFKLVFPGPGTFDPFKAAVVASAAVTVTAWVRKDATYNGNAPRLVLVGGYIGGIAADVVDSLSVGADTWEQLSVSGTPNEAGVIEWYIDCDGTAGSVYVDDMAVSQSGLPSADNLDYVSWGLPLASPYTLSGGGGSTVIVIED